MKDKRYPYGSPELTVDMRDKIENIYEEIPEEVEEEIHEETLYHKKEIMKIDKSKIIGLVIIMVFLIGLFLIPNTQKEIEAVSVDSNTQKEIEAVSVDSNTQKEIEAVSVDSNTQKEIEEIKNRAVEFKKQKALRGQIKDLNRELNISINNVVKIENKLSQYRQSSLQLIK